MGTQKAALRPVGIMHAETECNLGPGRGVPECGAAGRASPCRPAQPVSILLQRACQQDWAVDVAFETFYFYGGTKTALRRGGAAVQQTRTAECAVPNLAAVRADVCPLPCASKPLSSMFQREGVGRRGRNVVRLELVRRGLVPGRPRRRVCFTCPSVGSTHAHQ